MSLYGLIMTQTTTVRDDIPIDYINEVNRQNPQNKQILNAVRAIG